MLWIWIVEHTLLDQPSNTDRDSIRFVIAGVFPCAYKLLKSQSDLFFLGIVVICDELFNRFWRNIDKLFVTKSPCVQIGHADNLAENLDSFSGCRDVQKSAFPDNGCVRIR